MQLVASEIVAEAAALSPWLPGVGLALGVAVWLTGWRWHNFWLVALATVGAGVYGLASGRAPGGALLVTGVLFAMSAGVLAVELARVVVFGTAGVACLWAVRTVVPGWTEPWIAFLAGGLLGVYLFRVWVMTLTGYLGAVLAAHCGLALAGRLMKFDAVSWCDANTPVANAFVLIAALLGVAAQGAIERNRRDDEYDGPRLAGTKGAKPRPRKAGRGRYWVPRLVWGKAA